MNFSEVKKMVVFLVVMSFNLCSGIEILSIRQTTDSLVDSIIAITKTIDFGGDATATILNLDDSQMTAQSKFVIDDMTRDLMAGLQQKLNIPSKLLSSKMLEQKMKDRKYFNIVIASDVKNIKLISNLYNQKQLDYQGFLIIALIKGYTDKSMQFIDLEFMFKELWFRNILNVNILTIDRNDDRIDVFVGFPYQKSCTDISIRKIDSFVNSSFVENTENFFEDKLKNLNGCPLKLLVEEQEPFYNESRGKDVGYDFEVVQREFDL